MFVALVYLNEIEIFGTELFVDRGPEHHSTSLTVPQIASLPPEFCRRVLRAKERELGRRRNELRIFCPVIPPFGTLCFCEPLVIHQSPINPKLGRTPSRLRFASDHATTQRSVAAFRVNVTSATATSCTVTRELEGYYDDGGMEAVFEETFNKPRAIIRLTFRARSDVNVVGRELRG